MERSWNIAEQTLEDNATKLRLEFSSVHTDAVNAGEAAPSHDKIIMLRLWTSQRDRVATFIFERGGKLIRTEVEPVPGPEEVARAQPGEIVSLEHDGKPPVNILPDKLDL